MIPAAPVCLVGTSTGESPLLSSPVLRHDERMEATEDRERLAAYVVAERKRLGYPKRKDWQAVFKAVSSKSVDRLERGEKTVGDDVFAEVEKFFHWMPGSCRAIMAGHEPIREETMPEVVRISPAQLRWVTGIVEEVPGFGAREAERFYTNAIRVRRQWEERNAPSGHSEEPTA